MNTNNASSTSTLRPRAKRLISGLSEADETIVESTDSPPRRIASPLPSPFDSRSASPIPPAHPQRSTSANRFAGSSWGRRAQVQQQQQRKGNNGEAASLAGLWGSSWTTLQGLATDLLGNDLVSNNASAKGGQKRPLGKLQSQPRSSAHSEWGPQAPTSHPASSGIGWGTREERESALRAQKRKDMLLRQDSSYADALGKFKRRLSDDHESSSAPPSDQSDRAALVYLHHVQKADTLAGITIKYSCAASVVRKANRMWPNDTVQVRQTIVLPVDACGVKGKPVSDDEAANLLNKEAEVDLLQAEEVTTPKPNTDPPTRDRKESISTNTTNESEPPWTHSSWILLPNNHQPTEIVRLSRLTLGYFPPARRKSGCFSDLDTPSTSLDLARKSTNDTTSSPPALQRPRRQRRPSNAGNGYFPSYLAGPGGVGTMNKNVHFPGPAQDGLNKLLAKHLPDVAPPKNQTDLYQPELPLYTDNDDLPTPTGSGYVTPSLLANHNAYSHNGNVGAGVSLENVGGAIESWARRMLSPKPPIRRDLAKGPRGPRVSVGAPGMGQDGVGDLIEMTDEFEIGGDSEDEEERGRQGSVVNDLGRGGGTASGTGYLSGAQAKSRTTSSGFKAGGGGGKKGKDD